MIDRDYKEQEKWKQEGRDGKSKIHEYFLN